MRNTSGLSRKERKQKRKERIQAQLAEFPPYYIKEDNTSVMGKVYTYIAFNKYGLTP